MTTQTAVAIGLAIASAVRADPGAAARAAGTSAGLLAIGAQASLWLYLWCTDHFPFRGPFQSTWWFVLGWHSYYVPLNLLWCATALAVGRILRRVDPQRRPSFVVLGVAAQWPVLMWFAAPVVHALVRAASPREPWLLRIRMAFAIDVVMLMIVMPALTLAAALKGCTRPTSD
jgi:hypothetical protein